MIGFMLFVFTLVAGVLVLVRGLQWIGRGPRTLDRPQHSPSHVAELERMEDALARLEARLDDLQDQQRFLERLLARRQDDPKLPPGQGGAGEGGNVPADGRVGGGDSEPEPDSILFDLGE